MRSFVHHAIARIGLAMIAVLACISSAHAAVRPPIFPVHGTVLALPARGDLVASIDGIPGTYPAQTRSFHTHASLRPAETFDAYLDTRDGTLHDVHEAALFVAGLPNHLITHVETRGDVLPPYQFESQTGHLVRFSDFLGKVVLLSFVYTRCPDPEICPAISGKFAYLQHHLDPQHFALVTVTLDPLHDSPRALQTYAAQFAADPARWSLLTGESAQIKNILDAFGLDALETTPGRIIHGDTLVMIGMDGKIADLIPTSGWAPDDVISSAKDLAGLSSNPLRRFELATVAGILGFCGGSVTTGVVVVDSVAVLLGFVIFGGLLIWITRNVIIKERY